MADENSTQIRAASYKGLVIAGTKCVQHLRGMEKNAQAVNDTLLHSILRKNARTAYGEQYGFGRIRDYREFAEKVPLTDYADYDPYIERMNVRGEKNVLTAASPEYFCVTAGTRGTPKKIPCTGEQSRLIRNYVNLYRFGLVNESLGNIWAEGATFSPVEVKARLSQGGTPEGYFSSKMLNDLGDLVVTASLSPRDVIWSDPGEDTRYLHLLYGLACRDVSEMNAAYVTVLLEMMRYLEANWQLLVQDIREGKIHADVSVLPEKRARLEAAMQPDPERADELEREFSKGFEDPVLPRIWKKLSLVVAAAGASFAPYLRQLRRYIGEDLPVYYHGYTASEAVLGVPVRLNSSEFLLLPDSCFYEFQPYDEENGTGVPQEDGAPLLKMNQLEKGKAYLVIITTVSGFYRYRMHDVVRVVDFRGTLPVIEFLYREGAVLSISGEHLSEATITKAVFTSAEEAGLDLTGFSVYTDAEAKSGGRYVFLIEPAGTDPLPDRKTLAETIFGKLKTLDLGIRAILPATAVPVVRWLRRGTYERYREWQGVRSMGGNQIKPPQILRTPEQIAFFTGETESEE